MAPCMADSIGRNKVGPPHIVPAESVSHDFEGAGGCMLTAFTALVGQLSIAMRAFPLFAGIRLAGLTGV